MGTPLFAVVATVASLLVAAPAFAQTAPAQTVWRLLDYIAVDYPEAISDGRIVNQAEYDEMKEFSSSARTRIEELPPSNGKASLQQQAASLERSIAIRAPATSIAMAARNLAAEVIKIYPVPLAPSGAPDVARGAALYTEHCASCHGATGNGDGPQARRLDPPPPIAFTDEARARERSVPLSSYRTGLARHQHGEFCFYASARPLGFSLLCWITGFSAKSSPAGTSSVG